jgi:MFS family permease
VLELVDPEHITNAMSLNTAVMTGSRIFGPALAAWLAHTHGTSWCFLVNTVSFFAVIGALVAMDPAKLRVGPTAARGGTPVRDGLRYVWGDRRVRIVFLVMTVVSTFAFNYSVSFKLLADGRFHQEAAYGILLAVTGFGSLLGSLFLARKAEASMTIYLASVLLQAVGSLALAWAPNIAIAYVLAVPMGFGGALFISAANSLVQQGAPPTMRSRLLALTGVAFLGSTPIGSPITGWIGDHISAEWSLAYGALCSLACIAVAAAALRIRPAPYLRGIAVVETVVESARAAE